MYLSNTEQWPAALGEAKGMHLMRLHLAGDNPAGHTNFLTSCNTKLTTNVTFYPSLKMRIIKNWEL